MASKPVTPPICYQFGDDFELDLSAYELRSGGVRLKLKPIPMQLLTLLVEHHGELVTREQIVERIWGPGVFLDTDNSINAAISRIRRVLREVPGQPQFVLTLPCKGYRFIAPVTISPAPKKPIPVAAESPPKIKLDKNPVIFMQSLLPAVSPPLSAPSPAVLRGKWIILPVLMVALLIALGLSLLLIHRTEPRPEHRAMLAILPFQNFTGDPNQDYFSDGLTEEMITQVGNLDPAHVGVIARTSVMHYKNTNVPLTQIAQELKVEYVLEGSIRRDAQKVIITAQLIEAKNQTHLWARQYDRQLSSLLALQAEVAQEISHEVARALGEKTVPITLHRSLPASYDAYDLYLKGLYFANKRSVDGFQKAVLSFQQALEKDPNYSRAYAGLADVYALMSDYGVVPASEYMPKAREAALRALQIDDSLAEAHTSLAMIAQNYDWDWQTAEREYKRAVQLNPNYATAHHWYAESLGLQGRFDEAMVESERARELNPLSLIIASDDGALLYFSRQYDRAIERFQSILAMDPSLGRAHLLIGAYVEKGQFDEALADLASWRKASGDGPWVAAWETYVYGRSGHLDKAYESLRRLHELNRKTKDDPTQCMILAYAGVNDKAHLLAWLEQATRAHTNIPTFFKVEPMYDSIRGNPRFEALVRRAGLDSSPGQKSLHSTVPTPRPDHP